MDESPPLVLVTGASGYIAAHTIKLLLESGEYRVRGTVRDLDNKERCEKIKKICPDPAYPLELVEANLLEAEGWKKAVVGCTFVLHIASPFAVTIPDDENFFIKPAVEGTLNVLKACSEVGGVRRVVVTSSTAAVIVGNLDKEIDEECWSNINLTTPYEKSKALAERAAWDFVKELPEEKKFELTVVNPGFVIGPVLLGPGASVAVIKQMLTRQMSAVPEIYMPIVDVRDVAKSHIKAMKLPEAAGQRHLLFAEVTTFFCLSNWLAGEFNHQGYNVPTRKAPNFLMWLLSWFKSDIKMMYPFLGKNYRMNNDRMRRILGVEPMNMRDSVIEMGHTMIDLGLVDRSPSYKGRQPKE